MNNIISNPIPLTQTYPYQQSVTGSMQGKLNKINLGTNNANAGINVGNAVNGISTAISGITNIAANSLSPATATSGREATANSLKSVGTGISGGAAAGALLGSVVPGIGTAIGALVGGAAGLVGGAIGKKGEVTDNGFYSDPSLTLGEGLIGAFTNRKLRKKYNTLKDQAEDNRLSLAQSQELAANYSQESDPNVDIFSYINGGIIPNSLVYTDDGELIKTPYGDISQVPEQNNPTDSNLLNLPEGSKILSDTLKVPGTKKTFAEAGKKIMNTKKSKYNDKYSENSQKLNDMNNKIAYDNLFALQEEVKKKKGIKPKTKDLVQAAQNGTVVTNSRTGTFSVGGKRYNLGEIFDYKGKQYKVTGTNKATPINQSITKTPYSDTYWATYDPTISWGSNSTPKMAPILDTVDDNVEIYPTNISSSRVSTPKVSSKRVVKQSNSTTTPPLAPTLDEIYPMYDYEYSEQPLYMAPLYRTEKGPQIPKTSSISVATNPNTGTDTPDNQNNLTATLSDIATGIAKYAPVISNLMTDHETTDAVYNPYANAILKVARSRKANIQPMLRKIAQNIATSNYNASQVSPNTGAGLAYRLQSAIAANDATTKALAYKNNLDNQYLAEYANMMNDLGKQFVNSTVYADDVNRKSRASARNIRRQGLSQLSGIAQNDQLMRNQKNRDDAMMALYAPFLEAGFTKDDLKNLQKYLRKGGNNVG